MDRSNLELASSFIESHIVSAARELEIQAPDIAAALILAIPLTQAQRMITQMLPVYSARILDTLSNEEAASILSGGDPNQIATILRRLPGESRGGLLDLLPERLAGKTRRLLKHAEDSVGAWMIVDVVMLPDNIIVADALNRISESSNLGDGDAIQVLTDDQQPAGYVSVAELLRAGNDILVSSLCHEAESLVISSKMSLRAAASHSAWHMQDNLVVINPRGQVDGILRHRDLRRGLQVAQSKPVPLVDDSLVGGIAKSYLSTFASLFSLLNETTSAKPEMAESKQDLRR